MLRSEDNKHVIQKSIWDHFYESQECGQKSGRLTASVMEGNPTCGDAMQLFIKVETTGSWTQNSEPRLRRGDCRQQHDNGNGERQDIWNEAMSMSERGCRK